MAKESSRAQFAVPLEVDDDPDAAVGEGESEEESEGSTRGRQLSRSGRRPQTPPRPPGHGLMDPMR